VEKKRGAPTVAEFAFAIDRGVVGRDQGEAEFILAGEGGGDLGVAADGVAVPRKVRAEVGNDIQNEAEVGVEIGARGVETVGEGGALDGRDSRFWIFDFRFWDRRGRERGGGGGSG